MAANFFGSDSDAAWIEECGENGDGCSLCGGKHEAHECPVFENSTYGPYLAAVAAAREIRDAAIEQIVRDEYDFASDDEIETPALEVTRTLADLVAEVADEDVNGMDASEYRQYRNFVMRYSTADERERYYKTGELPTALSDDPAYLAAHQGMMVNA